MAQCDETLLVHPQEQQVRRPASHVGRHVASPQESPRSGAFAVRASAVALPYNGHVAVFSFISIGPSKRSDG